MEKEKPSEIDPRLKDERLIHIGKIIRDVRHKVLDEDYYPEEGDGPWSIGCRIYERTINKIDREKNKLPWLQTFKDGLYFIILIEGLPIRYKRNMSDTPSLESLNIRNTEKLLQQAFYFGPTFFFWRILVDTDEEGKVLDISLARYETSDDVNLLYKWKIQLEEEVTILTPMDQNLSKPVVLDEPKVTKRESEKVEAHTNGRGK